VLTAGETIVRQKTIFSAFFFTYVSYFVLSRQEIVAIKTVSSETRVVSTIMHEQSKEMQREHVYITEHVKMDFIEHCRPNYTNIQG